MRAKFMAPKAVGVDGKLLSAGSSVDVIHIAGPGLEPRVILENVRLHSCMLHTESTMVVWLEITTDEAATLDKLKDIGSFEVRQTRAEPIWVEPEPDELSAAGDEPSGYRFADEPASPSRVAQSANESQPREKAGRKQVGPGSGLGIVRTGLSCHYARLVVYFLALCLLLVVTVTAGRAVQKEADPTPSGFVAFGALAVVGLLFVQTVLGITGSILCLWVPRESGAWGYIFASLVLDVLAIPLGIFLSLRDYAPAWAAPAGFVSWVLFMLFMSNLADYLDDRDSAAEARGIVGFALLHLVLPVMLLILVLMLSYLGAMSGLGISVGFVRSLLIVTGLYWLARGVQFFFLLLRLIDSVRSAIRSGGTIVAGSNEPWPST